MQRTILVDRASTALGCGVLALWLTSALVGCADPACDLTLTALGSPNGHAPFGLQLDFTAASCDGATPADLAAAGTFTLSGPDGSVDDSLVQVGSYDKDGATQFSLGFCAPSGASEGTYTLTATHGGGSGKLAFNLAGAFDGSMCDAASVLTCGAQCDQSDCGATVGCCQRTGCGSAACGDDGCGLPCGSCDAGESCSPQGKCSAPWTVAPGEHDPRGVTTDSYFIYWTLDSGGAVKRAEKNGSNVVVLGAVPGWNIRVDAKHVFWTAHTTGMIMKAAKDGSNVNATTGEPEPIELATGQTDPRGMALDDTHVYWTDVTGDAVRRIAKAGGDVEDLATGQEAPRSVAVQGDYVYWTNSASGTVLEDGTVNRVLKTGGAIQRLAKDQVAPWGIYVDDTHVYWTSYVASGAVQRMVKGGGTPEVLAQGFVNPRDITGDVDSIYWLSVGSASGSEFNAGAVYALKKNLSAGQTVADKQKWVGFIAVDASGIYWTQGGTLQSVFQDGRVMGAWK